MSPTDLIKARAVELGFGTVGICPADPAPDVDALLDWLADGKQGTMSYLARSGSSRGNPECLLPGARSVVAVTLNYNQPNPAVPGQPRIARYALGRDYHKVLRSKLHQLADFVVETVPGSTCRPCVDSAPILERSFAHRAGLGWFGKNTMLIDSRRGSWFFIGLLLTTAKLEPDGPSTGFCGSCTKCIDACPTGAIVHEQGRWQIDARRCISYQTIEHKGPLEVDTHGWTFGCDVCQEVCPFNETREAQPVRAAQTVESDFAPRTWPNLQELAQIDEVRWDELTRGSPVRRTGLEGLRRNALANLQASVDGAAGGGAGVAGAGGSGVDAGASGVAGLDV